MLITIPTKLPSLNEVINANRGNKYAGNTMKKNIDALLCLYIKNQCKVKYKRIFIKIDWYESTKKRDFDNIVSATKFILDALVKCQVIPNDGWKQIEPVLNHNIHHDKDNPRVEILILDAEDLNARIKYNDQLIKQIQHENRQLYIKREKQKNPDQLELEI